MILLRTTIGFSKKEASSNSTKAEIKHFMMDNNIYFEETSKKRDLLEVLKAFNINREYPYKL